MKRLIIACQFLTRLPMPRVGGDAADFAASMRWFPAVGLIVGSLVAGAAWTASRIDPWAGALAALTAWVWVTGALHLDGLGDLADARGAAHKDRDAVLRVLADPHVGSFAVVAIALQLIAKAVLLHALCTGPIWPLVLVPFAARIGPLAWTRWLPPLHAGLGARFRGAVRTGDLLLWLALLLAAGWWLPALLAAPLLVAGYAWWLKRAIGGISGDGHGAGIELVETALLVTLVVARAFA